MNKRYFDAHSRLERAVADLKSMNLPPHGRQSVNECMRLAAPDVERLAHAFEELVKVIKIHHQPADPAPNAINRRTK